MKEDKYYQSIFVLVYNGTYNSEFLGLKKENKHLTGQYFDVIDRKTKCFMKDFRRTTNIFLRAVTFLVAALLQS